MRLVDFVEERARELALAGSQALLLAQFHQLGVVADVDDAEGLVLGPETQRHFAGRALQVLDIELPAARRVEERRERLVEDLCRREAAVFR